MLKDPKAREVFQSLAKIEVGDERKVLFWSDRWINGFTAEEIAPAITALVPTRRRNSRTVFAADIGQQLGSRSRGNPYSGELHSMCQTLGADRQSSEKHAGT
jgi:hypothetical protein